MIWIIRMGAADDHLLPIMQTEEPLVDKIVLVNFILQMILIERTVPKKDSLVLQSLLSIFLIIQT